MHIVAAALAGVNPKGKSKDSSSIPEEVHEDGLGQFMMLCGGVEVNPEKVMENLDG